MCFWVFVDINSVSPLVLHCDWLDTSWVWHSLISAEGRTTGGPRPHAASAPLLLPIHTWVHTKTHIHTQVLTYRCLLTFIHLYILRLIKKHYIKNRTSQKTKHLTFHFPLKIFPQNLKFHFVLFSLSKCNHLWVQRALAVSCLFVYIICKNNSILKCSKIMCDIVNSN